MTRFARKITAMSSIALIAGAPALAQDDTVQVLAGWDYNELYSEGWSVENMFDEAEIIDASGQVIGDVENIIFSNEGELLGVVAQVGGLLDIVDTHVHIPWDEVSLVSGIQQLQVLVTEDTLIDYDVFGNYWDNAQTVTADETATTQKVDSNVAVGPDIFKATDLIGDYAYLSDGTPYGYISDLIVQDGAISAIVTDAATYGWPGYYAYPFADRGSMIGSRYELQYPATEVETIESFNYENLQSRLPQ